MEHESLIMNFIKENFLLGDGLDSLQSTDSFLEKGILDSTGVLELISFLEERFEIQIKDEEILPDNLDSVKKIAQFIKRKQSAIPV